MVVRHNRWQKGFLGTAPVGLKGQTSISEWTDNAYDDGTPIASP